MTALLVRVNLLGRVELMRRDQRRLLQSQVALSVTLGFAIAVGWLVWQRSELAELRERHAAHTLELARLAPVFNEAAALRQSLLVVTHRRAALQNVGTQQHAPARLWVELARDLPPGVRFKQIKHDGSAILVTGTVASGPQLALLMGAWDSPALAWQRAELVTLSAVAETLGPKVSGGPPSLQQAEAAVQRPGELTFAIRLLLPSAPVTPAAALASASSHVPLTAPPVQP